MSLKGIILDNSVPYKLLFRLDTRFSLNFLGIAAFCLYINVTFYFCAVKKE